MAFGDLVKQATDDAGVTARTVYTPDLLSNPTSGNLLVVTFASDRDNRTVTSPPSGFTELHNVLGHGGWAWYYKVSVGTEQTTSLTWDANCAGVAHYVEYEWDGSTPTIVKNDDQTNIATVVTTQASGAATPTSATNICIAAHGSEVGTNVNDVQAVDGSWIEDIAFGTTQGEMIMSRLVNAALSSQEATFTCTDTGDAMYGAIAVFNVVSGATGKSNPLNGSLGGCLAGPIS